MAEAEDGKGEAMSDDIVERLRGRYAMGPHLPNGEPEFGWRQFQATPINVEAADEITRLRAKLAEARDVSPVFRLADAEIEIERLRAEILKERDKALKEAIAELEHIPRRIELMSGQRLSYIQIGEAVEAIRALKENSHDTT